MRLRKIKEVKLNHEYYTINRKTINQNNFMARDKEKNASLISLDGNILNEYEFESIIESFDYDDETEIIAIVYDEFLCIYNSNFEKLYQQSGMYKSVLIQNRKLWCIKALNEKELVLIVYNLDDFRILAKLEIEDVFHYSGFILFEGLYKDSIILWMAGGQDGQLNYIVKLDGNILSIKEIGDLDTYPITISLDKKSYINFDNESMKIYSTSKNSPVKKIDFDSEENNPYNIIYLTDEQILFQSYKKLRVYNKRFDSLNEVNIFKLNYESLKSVSDRIYSCEDFGYIEKIGDQIIIPYRKNEILIAAISDFEYRFSNQLKFEFKERSL